MKNMRISYPSVLFIISINQIIIIKLKIVFILINFKETLNIETIYSVKPYFTWLSTFTVMRIQLVITNLDNYKNIENWSEPDSRWFGSSLKWTVMSENGQSRGG